MYRSPSSFFLFVVISEIAGRSFQFSVYRWETVGSKGVEGPKKVLGFAGGNGIILDSGESRSPQMRQESNWGPEFHSQSHTGSFYPSLDFAQIVFCWKNEFMHQVVIWLSCWGSVDRWMDSFKKENTWKGQQASLMSLTLLIKLILSVGVKLQGKCKQYENLTHCVTLGALKSKRDYG